MAIFMQITQEGVDYPLVLLFFKCFSFLCVKPPKGAILVGLFLPSLGCRMDAMETNRATQQLPQIKGWICGKAEAGKVGKSTVKREAPANV